MAENIKLKIDEYVQNISSNSAVFDNGKIKDVKQQVSCFTTWGIDLWQHYGFPARDVRKALEYLNNKYFEPPYDISKFNLACFYLVTTFKEDYPQCWERDFPFVFAASNKAGTPEYKVDFKLLAEYIKQKGKYFFVEDSIYLYNSDLGIYEAVSNDEFRGYIMSFVNALNCTLAKTSGIDGAFKDVKSDNGHKIDFEAFNADRNIINFQNGILHLDTMDLTPHSPDILSTIQIPCDWNIKGNFPVCPVFDGYLNDLSSGDDEVIRFLWQFIGHTISNVPGYKTKSALFLPGKSGAGKSQIYALLSALVGKNNSVSFKIQELSEKYGAFPLLGKRFAGTGDMSFAKAKEMDIFKCLTGGDKIPFEQKYKTPISTRYNGTLLFCGNDMPKFGGDKGEATYNRMIIIPCNNVISDDKRDPDIIDKIYAEREAIVFKAVQALKTVISNGYKYDIPSVCKNETKKYKIDNDNVMQFLDECTMLRQAQYKSYQDNCTAANMYTAYAHWINENGERYQAPKSEFLKTACQFYGFDNKEDIKHKYSGSRFYKFTLKPNFRHLIGFPDSPDDEKQIKVV